MTKSKMGGMKLSQFSGIKSQPETETEKPIPEVEAEVKAPPPTQAKQTAPKEKPVSINIKIGREQHEWLNNTARTVRDNNTDPVPPGDRVYPQHLISVAIELLQNSDVDWSQVKNVEELKEVLNLNNHNG